MRIDFSEFVGRPQAAEDYTLEAMVVQGKRVLITGGGGSIGSDFACATVAAGAEAFILLDSSEHALYESHRRVAQRAGAAMRVMPIVGNLSDRSLMDSLLRQYRPDLILHAGAYKHVPLMEQNPLAAMANNAIGTYKLAVAALQCGVSQIVMVSTDKAVNPQSIMGASKRIAELVLLSHATSDVRMNSVRLGNVLGSSGSVVPLFLEQLAKGLPMTVTHADARRYFMTASEALMALLAAASYSLSGKILLAECGQALRVLDLAFFLARKYGVEAKADSLVEFTGLRPGDKLEEELLLEREVVEARLAAGLRVVSSPSPSASDVALAMERMDVAIRRGDIREVMEWVAELVPGYRAAELQLAAEVE